MNIAFVCLGNICRSPMAEVVARSLIEEAGLSEKVTVESFGTAGYHSGEGADPSTDAALARHGWPSGGHRARRIGRADVARLDRILCADDTNRGAVLALCDSEADRAKVTLIRSYDPTAPPGDMDVPDPWSGTAADFDRTLELIERSCRGLVSDLAAGPG